MKYHEKVDDIEFSYGCGNDEERGAYTFQCGTKSKAGNVQLCVWCRITKKVIEKTKQDALAVDSVQKEKNRDN